MKKREKLTHLLKTYDRVAVAFSGGVDSSFLLWASIDALGVENVLAVTATAPVYLAHTTKMAQRVAHQLGVRHVLLPVDLVNNQVFVQNTRERCYYCKLFVLDKIQAFATREGFEQVIEGANQDDSDQYRPGRRAVRQLGIASPLEEVGLTKSKIRDLSRKVGLSTWDIPADTCLATRFPHDQRISLEGLNMVAKAEELLREMGFRQVRVRHHGELARIEVAQEQIARLAESESAATITQKFLDLGYRYVTIDLNGYRWGSLEPLPKT